MYEYKVVPAPTKGQKAKGLKSPEERFAHALEGVMNTLAAEGWEYQRTDTLPSVERSGLTGSTTEWRNLLVFRRRKPSNSKSLREEPKVTMALPGPGQTDLEPDEPPLTAPASSETNNAEPAPRERRFALIQSLENSKD